MRLEVISLIVSFVGLVHSLIPLEVKGNRFVQPALDYGDDGKEFVMIGVDYQLGGASSYDPDSGEDVLSDEDVCLRDAYVLQQLGVNTIRVYTVNPWINHDKCMSIFNAAGIYVLLDVNTPLGGESLSRSDPGDSYHEGYLNHVFGVIDAFKGYPNLMGFFSGNEVVNDGDSAKKVPQYIRALQRDMKQYIAKHADRDIPVGYSAASDTKLRAAMWKYLECGDDVSRSDFYGLNSYDWCSGRDDWKSSGYGNLQDTFKDSSIPVFMSEYGCNVSRPRTFEEVNKGLYGDLSKSFAGGLIYEYGEEDNNYGLVDVKDDGTLKFKKDYDNLKKEFKKIKEPNTKSSDIKNETSKCDKDAVKKLDSSFQTNFTLPDCPAKDLLKKGGGNKNVGKIVDVEKKSSKYEIQDSNGDKVSDTSIKIDKDNLVNKQRGAPSDDDDDDKSSSSTTSASKASQTSDSSSSSSKDAAFHISPQASIIGSIFATIYMLV
jgi:hypothetical protein